MNSRYKKAFTGIALFICFSIISGCVTELTDETPLALVNGEPVTYGKFKRELEGLHLKREEKREIGPMDIKSFLDKLIRKRLFIQEGIRVGLHKRPDIKQALDSELKRQAVLLLHKEEIDDRVKVSDDEAWGEYCAELNNNQDEVERIKKGLSMDPNKLSKEMKGYIIRLRKNAALEIDPNFEWHGKGSCDPNKIVVRVNGKGVTYKDLTTALNESGEEKEWKSALQWLIDQELLDQQSKRFVPDRDHFEKVKKRLKKNLQKEGRKKIEDAYLKELREKAEISKEIIDPNALLAEGKDPNLSVAWINNEPVKLSDLKSTINVEDLKNDASEDVKALIDRRLQYIIDCRLIDQEALGKGYGQRSGVKNKIKEVEDNIIYNKFFREILIPSIKITDDEVETYYLEHKDLFHTPINVKLEEIRLKTEEEGDQIRSELEAGADFTFFTKRSLPHRITSRHWIPIHQIPQAIMEDLVQAEEGSWFGPVSWEKGYSIFFLKRRRGGEQIPFERAKKDVKERLWKERYDQAIKKWEDILKSSSEIVIYEDRFQIILSGVGAQGADHIK